LRRLDLEVLPEGFSICRLGPGDAVPDWATRGTLSSVTRTPRELSIVCADAEAPPGAASQRGWRALAVGGPLDFALTGILLSLAEPLAQAGVSIFAMSTHDTDLLLVPGPQLPAAVKALTGAGHRIRGAAA
jgi:hypothetical protein